MSTNKNKIGVLGIGAIGTVISHELQKNNSNQLFFFNRTPKKSLKLISTNTKIELLVNIQTSTTNLPHLDWLIICLKEHQFHEAHTWLKKLINPETKVAVIRNGLNLQKPLLDFTRKEQILECMIDCPTQLGDNGYFEQLRTPILTVTKNQLANGFELLQKETSIQLNKVADFKTENWKKLCESATLGSILCLSGETCSVFKTAKVRVLFAEIIKEALLVAQADGAKIESSFVDEIMTKLRTYPETKGSSMLTDRLLGKTIEIGAKNGVISDLGKTLDIKTPINNLIVKSLSELNSTPNILNKQNLLNKFLDHY